jgi:hypothetical protein
VRALSHWISSELSLCYFFLHCRFAIWLHSLAQRSQESGVYSMISPLSPHDTCRQDSTPTQLVEYVKGTFDELGVVEQGTAKMNNDDG